MSEMKWTKGPWKVRKDGTNSGRWLEIYVDGEHYDDGSEFVIAETGTVESTQGGKRWKRNDDSPFIEANAELMSAAPDLYEALEAVLEHTPMRGDCAALLRYGKAKMALAKARGESPSADTSTKEVR